MPAEEPGMRIIDIHGHLGKWPFPMADVSAKQAVARLKRLGIARLIVSSGLGIVYDFREGNRVLAEEIAPYPELLGYVTLNLNYRQESVQELDRHLASPKFVGAKIHPLYCRQKANSPGGQYLARAVAERGVPLLLHTYSGGMESPWNALPLAEANPGLTIILAHMGGDAWWEGIAAAQASPNLLLDPCATWADAEKVTTAVEALGAERLVFGSDYTLFDPAHTLGMVAEADVTLPERDLIMHGNAERIFGARLGL
jgi:predicted TIM-barrel fold metal-dependent hydrolase